jgi:mono/diheme cytochrome c family protein
MQCPRTRGPRPRLPTSMHPIPLCAWTWTEGNIWWTSQRGPASATAQPAVLTGADVFNKRCAGCHGADGRGIVSTGTLNFTSRDLQAKLTDQHIAETNLRGRSGLMPAFGTQLHDQQISALTAYIREFSSSSRTLRTWRQRPIREFIGPATMFCSRFPPADQWTSTPSSSTSHVVSLMIPRSRARSRRGTVRLG